MNKVKINIAIDKKYVESLITLSRGSKTKCERFNMNCAEN